MTQETIEEAAEWFADDEPNCDYDEGIKTGKYQGFIAGAKRQQERMYSEEEVYDLFAQWIAYQQGFPRIDEDEIPNSFRSFNEWFEQFKK